MKVDSLAAGGVSRANAREESLPPRERSACVGSGERSSPHPGEPLAGAPKAQTPRRRGATDGGAPAGFRRTGRPDGLFGGSLRKEEESEPDRVEIHPVG